ncbi:FtsX-like permease family protein [Bacteroidetes/Chlorobi group bacterium ChocPot_Mid]|nr:MAG: FtsX-like permease family protein [Bacteroidetes/Chlorobi group bacterium ChocPot_Mid]
MNIGESILQALDSVRMNKLRASLTLLSIAIGVFAIITAGGLVASIDNAVIGEIQKAGATSFQIRRMPAIQMGGHDWMKYSKRKPITYSQYIKFKKQMTDVKLVSSFTASQGFTIKSGVYETDPNVTMFGADENFLEAIARDISNGRAISPEDIEYNRNIALIGNDIVVKVFPHTNPIGQRIKIKNMVFEVVGVIKTKGAIMGQSQDNWVVIPLPMFLKYYANFWEEDLSITVKAFDKQSMYVAFDESIGLLRSIRNVKPWEENDFEIETNESIGDQFAGFTGFLSIFGSIVGAFSLIAAGIGIMNIMLVTVKERTREIGVRKAVGAKRSWILWQFIIESITLCILGGLIGIGFGLLVSAYFGSAMGLDLAIPISSIITSLIVCTLIGIVFGAYPAWKASKLDPIDALRYE